MLDEDDALSSDLLDIGEIDPSPIKILSWTAKNFKTEGQEEDWFSTGFEECRPFLESWMTCQSSFSKSNIKTSEVILFRGRRIDVNDLPTFHSPRQKWLFYEFEPPYKVWQYINLTLVRDKFNLTATYSRESDFFKNGYIKNRAPLSSFDPSERLRAPGGTSTYSFKHSPPAATAGI